MFGKYQNHFEEAGSDLSKVIKTTVFMVTGNDFAIK
jgi:enamine deaminase RidA (YjgF/YER057c/UK114 family)